VFWFNPDRAVDVGVLMELGTDRRGVRGVVARGVRGTLVLLADLGGTIGGGVKCKVWLEVGRLWLLPTDFVVLETELGVRGRGCLFGVAIVIFSVVESVGDIKLGFVFTGSGVVAVAVDTRRVDRGGVVVSCFRKGVVAVDAVVTTGLLERWPSRC
jgi:hypothetical protein